MDPLSHLRSVLSVRQEANAITAHAFRNGFLETLHMGKYSELLEDHQLSRITDREMKKLMIEASAVVEKLLRLREEEPRAYAELIFQVHHDFTKNWDTAAETDEISSE